MLRLTLLERLNRKAKGYGGKVKRLSRSLHEGAAHPDDAWALTLLTPAEALIYQHMDARDREHACRVTRRLVRNHPQASPELQAAALLHDCGKSVRSYRLWERVFVGLVPHRISRMMPPMGALGIRAHHPELGAQLLRKAGARPRVTQLVARHHHVGNDAEAALLHHYDETE